MLPRVADWLQTHAAQVDRPLAQWLVVTPGRAAQRRLVELLVGASPAEMLTPPTLATLGSLPEHLYDTPQALAVCGADATADDLDVALARMAVLRDLPTEQLQTLLAEPPGSEDVSGWFSLSQQLGAMADDLAAWRVTPGEVIDLLQQRDLPGESRWRCIEAVEAATEQRLRDAGRTSRRTLREAAIAHDLCRLTQPLALVACMDLTALVRRMLAKALNLQDAASSESEVQVLLPTLEEHASGFADDGCLDADYWAGQRVDVDASQWRVADKPQDQAAAVVAAVAEHAGSTTLAADEVTVGVADETMLGTVRRTLELAGAATRVAAGQSMAAARPVVFLRQLAQFAATSRVDALAKLLRHPDVEQALMDQTDALEAKTALGESADSAAGVRDWLSFLDRYVSDHLQQQLTGVWLGDATRRQRMKRVYDFVLALLTEDGQADERALARRRPLNQWMPAVRHALLTVYGERELSRFEADQRQLADALAALSQAMVRLSQLSEADGSTPACTAAQAIGILLAEAERATLPEPGRPEAVELVGFLETPLDDARLLVLTNVNDGVAPSSQTADPFLPDTMRRALGMMCNHRRYARDLLLFQVAVHARERAVVISGRRTSRGDPLKPSRLLLACDDATLLRRLQQFYDAPLDEVQDGETANAVPALLLPHGETAGASVPYPRFEQDQLDALLERLPVTALKTYVDCPYRFYLKHLARHEPLEDAAREMDALVFGSVVHDVLKAFGQSEAAASSDAQQVMDVLTVELAREVARRFGSDPGVTVRVQAEQVRQRLERFAQWQAAQVAQGWRIVPDLVESDWRMTITHRTTLVGRIDRVDRMEDGSAWRLLDYKTGDQPPDPEKDHRQGPRSAKQWVNFQLPMYVHMLRNATGATGANMPQPSAELQTGYIALSKVMDQPMLHLGPWGDAELAEALEAARQVVGDIEAGVFWPPRQPTAYADAFSPLTLEGVWGREEALCRSSEQEAM